MSDYIVSARKYRPQDFSSVVGQENIVKTLKNAIKNGKLAQAYLFSGPVASVKPLVRVYLPKLSIDKTLRLKLKRATNANLVKSLIIILR